MCWAGFPPAASPPISARKRTALTTADLNRAVQLFDTDKLLWIVVGDRAKVEPQLKALGLPVEVRSAP